MDTTIPCPCPAKGTGDPRHEQDTVTLRDRLDFRSAVTMRKAISLLYTEDPGADMADVLAMLTEHYILAGVTAWTVVDDKGKPVAVTKTALRSFMEEHEDAAMVIADAADDLYSEQVLLPLLARARDSSTSSPATPTTKSTSAQTDSPAKPRTNSKRSSTTTTRTDDTGTITSLPVGDSNSSRSSASAA